MRRGRQRWPFLLILAGGIGAFGLFWSASNHSNPGTEPAFGGSYVEGTTGAPARINPVFAGQNATDEALTALIFSGLTRLDDRGQPFPDLAEGWQVSPDGLTYTLRLRTGVIWHDGQPFSADDVVFTLEMLRSPSLRSPPALSLVLAGAGIAKVDPLTVRIDLPQPYAPLLAYLSMGVLPQHQLGAVPPGELFDAAFNQRPVGTGPYRLDQLTQDRAVLAANAAYHFGQPYIQRLELRFFRDDGALMAALRNRELNGAFFQRGVGPSDYQYLEGGAGLHLSLLSSGEVTLLYLNLQEPMFADRRVRQALLYAIDREGLASEGLFNQDAVATSPLPPGTWATTEALAKYGPDPVLASALLEEAGYLRSAGGVRSRAGVPLALTIATNNDPVRVAAAQAIAERWKALGADVTVAAGGATTLVRDLLEPRLYDVALFAYSTDVDPDPYAAWHSSQVRSGGRNISALRDPRIDRLLEEARLTVDPAARTEAYRQFQDLFAQEVPAIPLYGSMSLYAQDRSVQGTRLGYAENPGARFWQVQDWYVKTK